MISVLNEITKLCVCYLTEHTGGSFYSVDYANKKDLKIIIIEEEDLVK